MTLSENKTGNAPTDFTPEHWRVIICVYSLSGSNGSVRSDASQDGSGTVDMASRSHVLICLGLSEQVVQKDAVAASVSPLALANLDLLRLSGREAEDDRALLQKSPREPGVPARVNVAVLHDLDLQAAARSIKADAESLPRRVRGERVEVITAPLRYRTITFMVSSMLMPSPNTLWSR